MPRSSAAPRRRSTIPTLALAVAVGVLPGRAGAECPALDLGPAYGLSGSCGPGAATGDLCFVFCATGYAGSAAPSTVACQASGTWSATTATGCAPIQCPAFSPPTGYAASCTSTAYGGVCSVACDAASGYVGTPTVSTSTCQGSGTWSPSPATLSGCHVAQCAPLVAPPGYAASCTSTLFGAVCGLACDSASGYVGVPSFTSATCQLDETWSGPPGALTGCVLATCGAPPTAPAGHSVTCTGTSFSDTCAIACATGYVGAPSSASAACTISGWSVDLAQLTGCAPVDCGALVVANADTSDCAARSRFGEACTVACQAGHAGAPAASCTADGTWSVTGSCEPIACYSVPETNGESCGGAGETCLSGACVLPAAGQLCSTPADVQLGAPEGFSVDALHDLLSVQCETPVAAGRDLFLRAAVSAGDHRIAVDGGSGAAQAFVLAACPATACDPVELSGAGRSGTLTFASDGTVVVAVRLLDPRDADSVSVVLERISVPAPDPGGGGCGAGSGRGGLVALLVAILSLARSRRRGGAPGEPRSPR